MASIALLGAEIIAEETGFENVAEGLGIIGNIIMGIKIIALIIVLLIPIFIIYIIYKFTKKKKRKIKR